MQERLDLLHQEFVDYRRRHGRGCYPAALRRRAVAGLTLSERLQLAARLGLTAAQVRRWEALSDVADTEPQAFVEVPPLPQHAHDGPELRVEMELPSGVVVRMLGRIDAHAIRVLMSAVQHEVAR